MDQFHGRSEYLFPAAGLQFFFCLLKHYILILKGSRVECHREGDTVSHLHTLFIAVDATVTKKMHVTPVPAPNSYLEFFLSLMLTVQELLFELSNSYVKVVYQLRGLEERK